MTKKRTILFVCSINRTRSPAAEHLLRRMLWERGEEVDPNFEVSSAGILSKEEIWGLGEEKQIPPERRRPGYGWPPDDGAIAAMLKREIDISSHSSRELTQGMVEEANLIITMEERQKKRILSQYPFTKGRVFSLKEFEKGTGSSDIYDPVMSSAPERMPYELTADDFEPCIAEIEKCLRKSLERIIQ